MNNNTEEKLLVFVWEGLHSETLDNIQYEMAAYFEEVPEDEWEENPQFIYVKRMTRTELEALPDWEGM